MNVQTHQTNQTPRSRGSDPNAKRRREAMATETWARYKCRPESLTAGTTLEDAPIAYLLEEDERTSHTREGGTHQEKTATQVVTLRPLYTFY